MAFVGYGDEGERGFKDEKNTCLQYLICEGSNRNQE